MSDDFEFNNIEDDEIVVLKLPRNEAKTLREMIRRQQAMSWLWKWISAFFLVSITGLIAIFEFGDAIKKAISAWLGA